jgi:hypothetical protein
MIPGRFIIMTLLLATSAGIAQGDDQRASLLQACLDSARDADATCSKLNDLAQWIECFDHATREEKQCVERALPGAAAKAIATEGDGDARPRDIAPKAATATPAQPATQNDLRSDVPDHPQGAGLAQDSAQPIPSAGAQKIAPKRAQPSSASNAAEPSTNSPTANTPADTASTKADTKPSPHSAAVSDVQHRPSPSQSDSQPEEPLKDTIKGAVKAPTNSDTSIDAASANGSTKPLPQSAATEVVEMPAARQATVLSEPNEQAKEPIKDLVKDAAKMAPTTPATAAALAPAKQPMQSWLVSEMPSPVDYRPLLTAILYPIESSEGGPGSLNIRCIGGQTALSIRTGSAWRASRKNALLVDDQINEQSAARQTWILSADAKSATYSGDPIALLRSFPEGARLMINVLDGTNARHEATFLLTGWDATRKRIGKACKWPKADGQASSGQR